MLKKINKFEIFARSAISKTSFWIALAPLIIKQFFYSILFPINCLGCGKENTLLCASCINAVPVYAAPSQRRLLFCSTVLIAVNYHHPLTKRAITKAKYRPYASTLLPLLSSLVIKYLYQFPRYYTYLFQENFVLIPIPLSRHKYARRGFNQAQYIAAALSQEFNIPINTNVLIKTKHTLSQTNIPYKQRKTNVKNTFSVLETRSPKNIILVDDVVTTGATLSEAAKTLKRAGAQNVWAIVLAKS